ncbi:MAG: hypothetical protein ABI277_01270 [Burkholderiaceae bacterium]
MSKALIAKAGALQVLMERFSEMDGAHAFMLSPSLDMPLLPVGLVGARLVH